MRSLRVEVFQHAPFEGLGAMEAWLRDRGHAIHYTRWWEPGDRLVAMESQGDSTLPRFQNADGADWLIIMGGPMSVNDEAELPWLRTEKQRIAQAIKDGKPVLGFCLGAQMIADVLGGAVSRNAYKEIGWLDVHATTATAHSVTATKTAPRAWPASIVPEKLTTFHWHGETFTLPPGAALLASSAGCVNQAFAVGEKTVGLQFHPEATPEGIAALLGHCAADLTPGPYVQSPAQVRAGADFFADNRKFLHALLEGLEARAASRR